MLVANALQAEPPLGWIRTFRTDEGEFAGTIDLKTHGTRIFVDAARAFALALGIGDTNTSQRIRLAGRRLNRDEREIAAAVDAYHFLQLLRLRAQRGGLEPSRRPGGGGAAYATGAEPARSLCAQRTRPAHAARGFPPGARAAGAPRTDRGALTRVAGPGGRSRRRCGPARGAPARGCARACGGAPWFPRSAGTRRAARTGALRGAGSRDHRPEHADDRIISIGAIAVTARTVRHDDAFEVCFASSSRAQPRTSWFTRSAGRSSSAGPIRTRGWWRASSSSATPGSSHSAPSSTPRSSGAKSGASRHAGLAALHRPGNVLAALFPKTENESLDDWTRHFGLPPIGRHHAIADAYANAQLLMIALEKASGTGSRPPGLLDCSPQRWLGRRR